MFCGMGHIQGAIYVKLHTSYTNVPLHVTGYSVLDLECTYFAAIHDEPRFDAHAHKFRMARLLTGMHHEHELIHRMMLQFSAASTLHALLTDLVENLRNLCCSSCWALTTLRIISRNRCSFMGLGYGISL